MVRTFVSVGGIPESEGQVRPCCKGLCTGEAVSTVVPLLLQLRPHGNQTRSTPLDLFGVGSGYVSGSSLRDLPGVLVPKAPGRGRDPCVSD